MLKDEDILEVIDNLANQDETFSEIAFQIDCFKMHELITDKQHEEAIKVLEERFPSNTRYSEFAEYFKNV